MLMMRLCMLRAWAAAAHEARPPGAADARELACNAHRPSQLMLMMFAHLAFNVEGLGRPRVAPGGLCRP